MKTFENCKQRVAEDRDYTSWAEIPVAYDIDDLYTEAAEMYMRHAANEKEQEVVKVISRLSDLFRLLIRKSNNHPELFSDLDRLRIDAARGTLQRHARPFDPRQVLRASDESLPYPDEQ